MRKVGSFETGPASNSRVKPVGADESVHAHPLGRSVRRPEANDATLRQFDTMVVNSGAHPRDPKLFREQMHAAADALTGTMHRLHGEDGAILVVRNTVPGHWECVQRCV